MPRTEAGLAIEVEDRVARLTIDRPERRNAMSRALMADIIGALDRFEHNDDVWIVVFRGAGDIAFSAGADLKERADADGGGAVLSSSPTGGVQRNLYEAVMEFGKPTIACINGFALGGGLELALACDLRIAAEGARLALPEAKRGLGANFGTQMLARVVPLGIAYELLYTGRELSAEQALRWGLVNQIHPLPDLDSAVAALSGTILANAPLSIRRYKSMLVRGRDLPLAAALRLDCGPDPYRSRDRQEGVAAFIEKREPRWQGR
jgi:enoyl-CoA hydratase